MKILLVNDYGAPQGGAEVITLGLRDELRRNGHDVRFFASSAQCSPLPRVADHECFGTAGSFRTLLQSANFMAMASLQREIREFRPDVVHVNLYLTQLSPLILRALRGTPAVYYAQWYRAICPLGTRRMPDGSECRDERGAACLRNGCLPIQDWLPLQLQGWLDEHWRGAFDRITAISGAVAAKLARFGGSAFHDAEVIHPGIAELAEREAFSLSPSLCFAGRLVKEKGTAVLLEAFALALREIPAAQLVIAGDGPEKRPLEIQSRRLGVSDSVKFLGQVTNHQASQLMRSAWAVCVPSVWEEPFGFVALEAQMNGTAVIASNTGGLPEVVLDGCTGFLAEAGNADALSAKLKALLSDRELAGRLGSQAHMHAREHFSVRRFAEHFEQLYGSMAPSALPARKHPVS